MLMRPNIYDICDSALIGLTYLDGNDFNKKNITQRPAYTLCFDSIALAAEVHDCRVGKVSAG